MYEGNRLFNSCMLFFLVPKKMNDKLKVLIFSTS